MAKQVSKTTKFISSIILTQSAGILGAIFTTPSIPTWYAGLNKPSFNPPNWLFGPVWTLLYLLMAFSLYLVWSQKDSKKKLAALFIFFTQLVLNSLWSIIFFGLHSPLFAFIEILFLLAFIVLTVIKFKALSKLAAYLLLPYLLWVTFASTLNLAIVLLN